MLPDQSTTMDDSTQNNTDFNYPEYSVLGPELTSFMIQVGFVEGITEDTLEFSNIESAFQHLFRNNKEYAVILWCGIPLRLSYSEDIPHIAEALVDFLEGIQNKKKSISLHLASPNLDISLNAAIAEEDLTIHAEFKKVPGNYEKAFDPFVLLKINREVFLCEWKMLLSQWIEAMKASKYKLNSIKANRFIKRLIQLNNNINKHGVLYS